MESMKQTHGLRPLLLVDGFGYNSSSWRNSEILAWLITLPDNIPVHSNVSGIIDFFYRYSGQRSA
ncbi:hypothetical protein CSA56_07165 [candidate division KSB3 bacterium]|uniref:Uncharacterized protein n=1 Tax=candidate division KSB3 bacterium TaxID=2044937 RepID=A0A2G6KGZ2_9BACT|nr:MAG: hypothetical protein CSA56_07165 [candidate division KSB3 bacterium]